MTQNDKISADCYQILLPYPSLIRQNILVIFIFINRVTARFVYPKDVVKFMVNEVTQTFVSSFHEVTRTARNNTQNNTYLVVQQYIFGIQKEMYPQLFE